MDRNVTESATFWGVALGGFLGHRLTMRETPLAHWRLWARLRSATRRAAVLASNPMGTFKCQACGNLHGAPVEQCGLCGSPRVVLVNDDGSELGGGGTERPQGKAFSGSPPTSFEDAIEYFKPLIERYVGDRAMSAEREAQLHAEAHARADKRAERESAALCELLGQTTTLVEHLFSLAESATTYIDTVLLKKPASPIVE